MKYLTKNIVCGTAIALLIIAITNISYAENAYYDDATKMVHIPVLNIKGFPAFQDIELILKEDGSLEVINIKEYVNKNYIFKDTMPPMHINIGTIFTDSNNSMWQVTGYYGGAYYTLDNDDFKYTVYKTIPGMNFPDEGRHSDLFMMIEGSNKAIFIIKLN